MGGLIAWPVPDGARRQTFRPGSAPRRRGADTPSGMTGVPRLSWLCVGLAFSVLACATEVGGGGGAGTGGGPTGRGGGSGSGGAPGTAGTGGSAGVVGTAGTTG